MESGSMVEKWEHMDALRVDFNTVNEVVDAFGSTERLWKTFGDETLNEKLNRPRSIKGIDPYPNSLDAKVSEDLRYLRYLRMGFRDSNAAIKWVTQYQEQNPDSKESGNLMIGVVKGLAENDLAAADNFFRTLPQGNAKWQASTFLAEEYANLGTQEAIAWANQFPKDDERMRTMIWGQLGSKLAQKDLEGTARWAETLPTGNAAEQVVSNLLSRWTAQDPQEAAIWAGLIQDSEKRVQAMKLLTNKWAGKDPVATASWLNNFPPSSELDPVVSEFVSRIALRDPEGAVGWASSIIDSGIKEKAMQQALRTWDRKDRGKANAWRMENGIQPVEIEPRK